MYILVTLPLKDAETPLPVKLSVKASKVTGLFSSWIARLLLGI